MVSPYMQQPHASTSSLVPLSPSSSFVSSLDDFARAGAGKQSSLTQKYALPHSVSSWNMPLHMNEIESDDYLHNPDPRRDRKNDRGGHIFTFRGLANLGCLFILVAGMMMLFAGFPLFQHFTKKKQTNQGGFNLGGINATGQISSIPGNFGLIDRDTPHDAYTKKSYMSNDDLILVFSDEFNTDGRTFYPGDDPYWEAVDLHYWGTGDLEWYDPQQVTTQGGALRLRLDKVDSPANNHNLNYRSAMLQTWNKFCFSGGLIEASVTLPGSNNIPGLWPAVWTMGNLGRAGHGASTDGMWPYTYDACDVGTLPNQTYPGTAQPIWASTNGDPSNNNKLSYLPGQRLSACTCAGESHPGPVKANGSYVGRGAPEIDVFEALIDRVGKVSQSGQWAPFNAQYEWQNTTQNFRIYNDTRTILNPYIGGAFQQCTSGLSVTNQDCYENAVGCYTTYGFEYKPGYDGQITWINDGASAWSLFGPGMGSDNRTEINGRPVPFEPMYIIANLGFSLNFGAIDFTKLPLPAVMSIDYIRIYQPKDAVNVGCDPNDFPTRNYIDTYLEAYTNPNLTTWKQFGQPWPKNKLKDTCSEQ
ncbi:hypothetical protein AX15_001232 [Amanita polypyramis BW_CC]|nr:hypothetical protein AX15_001232 [Amanita polypyramis BW_CC]